METPEARLASALDRLMPLLHNYAGGGALWRQNGIHERQVLARNAPIAASSATLPELAAGVALGAANGFRFGVEHSAPASGPFATPTTARAALDAVPGLWLVWNLNHTAPDDLAGYAALIPRVSMLHVADARLPETNEHLPIGMGTINFAERWALLRAGGFLGPAILLPAAAAATPEPRW